MADEIARLMDAIEIDPWREGVGFSDEVAHTLGVALQNDASDSKITEALEDWLAKYQPCLFGRIAAKHGLLAFCLLREADLVSDELVARKIQRDRLEWRRRGFEGNASGFVIGVLSKKLAYAKPTHVVRDIALRICTLYLQKPAATDKILLDSLYLEQPSRNHPKAWEWVTGVNYFSAQGDKRWWQDHRAPVGIGLSVNSVGHMVRSANLAAKLRDLEQSMETAEGDLRRQNIDSLGKALKLAMRTIDLASEGPSGKATELLPRPSNMRNLPRCPVTLDPPLHDKNYCTYQGGYHTDVTLPSEYFQDDVCRPDHLRTHQLDFTYLFDDSLDNPDHILMGKGERIRSQNVSGTSALPIEDYRFEKRFRALESEVDVRNLPDELKSLLTPK